MDKLTPAVFVLADAIILNSLCKMCGLLDSVKQALDLKRSQDEENKIHNNDYGEKAVAVHTYSEWDQVPPITTMGPY